MYQFSLRISLSNFLNCGETMTMPTSLETAFALGMRNNNVIISGSADKNLLSVVCDF